LKKLEDILNTVSKSTVTGTLDKPIRNLCFDSREVKEGDLFIAQQGLTVDGHEFIQKAIDSGAVAVLCQHLPESVDPDVTFVQVENSTEALAQVAAEFFGHPSAALQLIGITGTNGKTTVATLLYELLNLCGYKTGLLSTVKVGIDQQDYPTSHTTPDSIAINRNLKAMKDAGVQYCFMEVSSHGIHQHRTDGLHFSGGVFTNLTHDHLDYHTDFKEYRDVKKSFFDSLSDTAFALTNLDDRNGTVMLQNTSAQNYSYALKTMADFRGRVIENRFSGLLLQLDDTELWVRMIGSFNAYNLLAVYAVARLLGLERTEVLKNMSQLRSVGGRFQSVRSDEGILAIIDYAHTPDALKNVLKTINDIRKGEEQVITVIGCGGDRDRTKRPLMGQIAAQLSDQVIFTSDNPRTENPEDIVKEMEAGVSAELEHRVLSIIDREQAIRTATRLADKGDIILIAGKGHETYQEVNGVRTHFDDYEKIASLLTVITH
jgi:UDP-N-acetylmuramoyl-L-alanyl-D-glutamate--2,6-diaminopimelate ligase